MSEVDDERTGFQRQAGSRGRWLQRDAAHDAAVSYAKDAYDKGGETLRDGPQAVAKKVQDNPLGSLWIAGGIGFALAMSMTRPPHRPPPRWRYWG